MSRSERSARCHRALWPLAASFLLLARGAGAQGAPQHLPGQLFVDEASERPTQAEIESATDPAYFNGIGTPNRTWELQTDTTFSTSRVATQRFEVAAMVLKVTDLAGFVARTDFGAEDNTTAGFYTVQGPLFSLGFRVRSLSADHWFEGGFRLIPPWSGPNETDPAALQLALNATLASGQADDARWLSFASLGYQLYIAIQSRVEFQFGEAAQLFFGFHYGGRTSLTPLTVQSWLGPQRGIVGNAFADAFLGIVKLANCKTSLELGVHGEASLSSVWPGDATFPVAGEFFLGWSPRAWISARVFFGFADALQGNGVSLSNPYGVRATFFVP